MIELKNIAHLALSNNLWHINYSSIIRETVMSTYFIRVIKASYHWLFYIRVTRWVGSVLLIFVVVCVVLLCVLTFWDPFWDPCSDARYDFRIKMVFGPSLPPVVCRGLWSYLHYLCLLVHSGVQHILCCVFVLVVIDLCTLYCQFLGIVKLFSNVYFPSNYQFCFHNHRRIQKM